MTENDWDKVDSLRRRLVFYNAISTLTCLLIIGWFITDHYRRQIFEEHNIRLNTQNEMLWKIVDKQNQIIKEDFKPCIEEQDTGANYDG